MKSVTGLGALLDNDNEIQRRMDFFIIMDNTYVFLLKTNLINRICEYRISIFVRFLPISYSKF